MNPSPIEFTISVVDTSNEYRNNWKTPYFYQKYEYNVIIKKKSHFQQFNKTRRKKK